MEIRLAHPNEVEQIIGIIEDAKKMLAEDGIDQWQDGYPDEDTIFEDILENRAFVGLIDGEIVAYAALYKGNEASYNDIYEGKWMHNHYMYITFHRVAVSRQYTGQGIAQTFLQGLIEGEKGPDFRCDTHPDNHKMQHLLEKLGFTYCGKVPLSGVRLAYQKIKRSGEKSLFQEISEEDRWMLGATD
ncbi:GNAT family N-acetyltransferase [Streptococcus sp. DD13]|uniref:GNAT family N-acetyltransferase n=1 Tax=Streptococcus sp. DD13 TaxID=1777881 RepID=UPI0007969DD1|nr:GNAT family N-acetyltransferase [Streptococcus sp. DD13]KXT78470.1 Acetyltransferase [Streptococcus sp. DD13]